MTDTKKEQKKTPIEPKPTFISEQYTQQNTFEDQRFGEVTIWSKNDEDNLILMKQLSLDSEEEVKETVEQATERMKLNFEYIMKMVDFSVEVPSDDRFDVAFYYEAPFQDLKQEIQKRKDENRYKNNPP